MREGPTLSISEGPTLSMREGPTLSMREGLALDIFSVRRIRPRLATRSKREDAHCVEQERLGANERERGRERERGGGRGAHSTLCRRTRGRLLILMKCGTRSNKESTLYRRTLCRRTRGRLLIRLGARERVQEDSEQERESTGGLAAGY